MKYRRPMITIDGERHLVSRVVMRRHLGRDLLSTELVHHVDHDPLNNSIENLQIVSRAEHKRLHPEIGVGTRLKKVWHLDALAMVRELQEVPARVIAERIGCHEKTITRAVRTVLDVDLRTRRSLRKRPAPGKTRR